MKQCPFMIIGIYDNSMNDSKDDIALYYLHNFILYL